MEPPRTIVKKISTNFNTKPASPAISGRSTPLFHRVGDRNQASSPINSKTPFAIKRPPSAARVLETGRRAPSPFDRSQLPNERPASSLSARSLNAQFPVSKGAENTVVSVRVRPAEQNALHKPWTYNDLDGTIRATGNSAAGLDFAFDNIFTETSTNEAIYKACVSRLVEAVLDGFHGTVFAYGMTGTGKTYSMQGVDASPGIIPLALKDVFARIMEDKANVYSLRVSYLEIYNEKIRDLLNNSTADAEEIKLRDDPQRGIHAYPLTEVPVTSLQQFLSLLRQGDALRHSAATDFNAHSSRSHAVVQVIVESKPIMTMQLHEPHIPGKISTLNLIDLAGSEKAAADVERRKEGAYINKSLLTLGTVIARLTNSNASTALAHVPFRDSKLTRLLQHALSGLSLVSILATINTDYKYIMETTNTLKFASRAKFIPSRAKKAELFGGDVQLLVNSLRAEISMLRIQLTESQELVHRLQHREQYGTDQNMTPEQYNESMPSRLNDIRENSTQIGSADASILLNNLKDSSASPINERADARKGPLQSVNGGIRNVSEPISESYSPSGNFSLPTKAQLRPTMSSEQYLGRFPNKRHGETLDKLNSIADQELASNVLTKSQRSRDEARHLQLQIAQLKNREDERVMLESRAWKAGGYIPPEVDVEKENTIGKRNTDAAQYQYTMISPSIRAPKEGFI